MPEREKLIYRTKDSTADFRFEFISIPDGSERAYILNQPSYRGRDTDAHSTHRYFDDERDLHYICFEPPPYSRSDLKRIAAAWADHTQAYIRTGRRF